MDKLVRSHAKSHFDAFPEISHKISTDEQYKEAYRKFCNTRETDDPVIEDIIKPMADYWFMRRNLERYVHVWRSCLDSYCDDVVLFG